MNRRPTRMTIFNHKGGVGKTTLTANIAFALSSLGKSVLLVDSDPQCNLTSYLLSDEVVDDLLDRSSDPAAGGTIWTAVKPVMDQTGVGRLVNPIMIGDVALLPGDIRLSEFEEFLGDAWADGFKRRLGGLRATGAISEIVSRLRKQRPFDFVFYDTGPNIGPLNRVLVLDSDFFIVPVACDLFSMRALATLGQTIKKWIIDADVMRSIAPADAVRLRSEPRFLGYVPQRFRVYGQKMTREANSYFREIGKRVYGDVSSVLRKIDEDLAPAGSTDPVLGTVRDFTDIVQRAQREGVAMWLCSSRDKKSKEAARTAFDGIASCIVRRTGGPTFGCT